jgi:hypothetical protein
MGQGTGVETGYADVANDVISGNKRRSNRRGVDEFAQSQNRCGIRKVVNWGQILPQQILREPNSFNNQAIRTHAKQCRRGIG